MKTTAFTFLLLICAVNQAAAEHYMSYNLRVEYNGVFYRTDGNEAIVTSREEFEHDEIDSIIPPDASFKVPVKPTLTYEGDIVIPDIIFTEESEEGIPVIGIDFGAFAYAPGLLSVELPSTIQWIASYAFYDSPNISSIGPIDNVTGIGRASFKGCSSLTDFTVPDNTPGLLCSLFYDSGLQTLKLHKNIISIDNSIVQNCRSLERVICEVENPGSISWNQTANPSGSTDNDLGFWIETDCILEVPAQSVEQYRNDPMWRMFSEIRAIGSQSIDTVEVSAMEPTYFTPDGIKVKEPIKGEIYIEKTGSYSHIIVF